MIEKHEQFKKTPQWTIVSEAINELIANGDLKETTSHDLIVGHIINQIFTNPIGHYTRSEGVSK